MCSSAKRRSPATSGNTIVETMIIGNPNNIEVLLHCHCSPEPHPRFDAPAVKDALRLLLRAGCIEVVKKPDSEDERRYRTTDKGRAWVKALCEVEEPRAIYIDSQGRHLSLD